MSVLEGKFHRLLASLVTKRDQGRIMGAFREAEAALPPINMVLHCPDCHTQHVDAATDTWPNPPHKSHLCHHCGNIWRPADVPTNGVAAIETRGKADLWPRIA